MSVGRISGPLLNANLLRNGIDLSFDTDHLYLNVTDDRIGINTDSPQYDLDVNSTIRTTDLLGTTARFDNVRFSGNTISTVTGPLNIVTSDPNSTTTIGGMLSDNLEFNDNFIKSLSNSNIVLDPNGSGNTVLEANVHITDDLYVSGNINVDGNLSTASNIVIGDEILDTITIAPDFTQSIIPGQDDVWSLGENTGDSSPRRWSQTFVTDLSTVTTNRPNAVKVSDQLWLDGTVNNITGLQSNEDILLSPDTGITIIESTQWQDNDITNLLNTPLTFTSTGIGYLRIMGDNGFVLPAGDSASRPSSPELGDTRWNTDEEYLECFDGSVYQLSTGAGGEVTTDIMEELGNLYSLVLG